MWRFVIVSNLKMNIFSNSFLFFSNLILQISFVSLPLNWNFKLNQALMRPNPNQDQQNQKLKNLLVKETSWDREQKVCLQIFKTNFVLNDELIMWKKRKNSSSDHASCDKMSWCLQRENTSIILNLSPKMHYICVIFNAYYLE